MRHAIDASGKNLGTYSGNMVTHSTGEVIYWLDDGEVMAPMTLPSGRECFSLVGEFDGVTANDANGEIIFTISA
jgi:hypothetical protein